MEKLLKDKDSHQRCSIKEAALKNPLVFRPATLLKRDSSTGAFLWILRNFYGHLFWRTSANDSYWKEKRKKVFCMFLYVTYAFQSEFILCSCLSGKKLFARNRHDIWSLSDRNGTRTHKPIWLNGWIFVYELSGCGLESRYSRLKKVFVIDIIEKKVLHFTINVYYSLPHKKLRASNTA